MSIIYPFYRDSVNLKIGYFSDIVSFFPRAFVFLAIYNCIDIIIVKNSCPQIGDVGKVSVALGLITVVVFNLDGYIRKLNKA